MFDVHSVPVEVILKWPRPNYDHPATRGDGLLIVSLVFGSLSVIAVALRLHVRLWITRTFGADDILIIFALLFTIATSCLAVESVWNSGLGRHAWDVLPHMYGQLGFNVWILFWTYSSATFCIRTSVLLFYRQLTVKLSPTLKYAIWGGIAFNSFTIIGGIVDYSTKCYPIQAYWLSMTPTWTSTHDFKCRNNSVTLLLFMSFGLLGDLYSALLPTIFLLTLYLPHTRKGPLYALFGVGFFVVICEAVRFVLFVLMLTGTYDVTWSLWEVLLWSLIGLYVAIIAASTPALKAWVLKWLLPTTRKVTSCYTFPQSNSSRSQSVRQIALSDEYREVDICSAEKRRKEPRLSSSSIWQDPEQ